jgi:hypothetical protein
MGWGMQNGAGTAGATSLALFVLAISGCSNHATFSSQDLQSTPPPPATPYFAVIEGCVTRVTESDPGHFESEQTCSPVIEGADYDSTQAAVELWRKENCPSSLQIEQATTASSECTVLPSAVDVHYSETRDQAEKVLNRDAERCQPSKEIAGDLRC